MPGEGDHGRLPVPAVRDPRRRRDRADPPRPARGARNAQNRGLLVELDEAFLRAEADDTCRVVILGGTGPLFSSGHDMGSKVAMEEYATHPTTKINGATRSGAENRMLQEWHYYFENTRRWRNLRKITIAQVQGTVLRRRPHADVGLRPHRRRRRRAVRRRGRHPARHVRPRVLRPPVGVRRPQDEGAHAHRRQHRHRRGPPPRHGLEGVPRDELESTAPSTSPGASPSCPR